MGADLHALPSWVLFILIIGIAVGSAYVGMLLIQRLRSLKKLPADDTNNEVAGFIFAAVSVMYAVVLAFLVVNVWNGYQDAAHAAAEEAAAIVVIAHDSETFPEPMRREVHDRLRSYTTHVINNEWNLMRQGQIENLKSSSARADLDELRTIYHQLPSTVVNPEVAGHLEALSRYHILRLTSGVGNLPVIIWVVLVFGAVIVTGFGMIFYLENVRLHMLMIALLASLIAMSLWLILILENPYNGDLQVSPDVFKFVLYVLDTMPR